MGKEPKTFLLPGTVLVLAHDVFVHFIIVHLHFTLLICDHLQLLPYLSI